MLQKLRRAQSSEPNAVTKLFQSLFGCTQNADKDVVQQPTAAPVPTAAGSGSVATTAASGASLDASAVPLPPKPQLPSSPSHSSAGAQSPSTPVRPGSAMSMLTLNTDTDVVDHPLTLSPSPRYGKSGANSQTFTSEAEPFELLNP